MESTEKSGRRKQSTTDFLKMQNIKRSLLLTCGINFKIFDLPAPTQAVFWFMLFHWTDCNNYSIPITSERRKELQTRFSQKKAKDTSKIRSVQNILGRLSNKGLLVKLPQRKDYLSIYKVGYQIPF